MTEKNWSARISFGLLWDVFTSNQIPLLMRGSGSHEPALKFLNKLLRNTQDADYIQSIIAGALPSNYSGNTLDEVPDMVRSGIEMGLHELNPLEHPAESVVQICLAAIRPYIFQLFHDQHNEHYAMVGIGTGRKTLRLRSAECRAYIRRIYYREFDKPIPPHSLDGVLDILEAEAQFDGPTEDVHLRVAGSDDKVFIDLANDKGEIVEIGPEGWKVTRNRDVKFVSATGMKPLPLPIIDGSLEDLRKLLGLSGRNWVLVLAFLINALKPDGPYMCLLISAEQGSGKSVLCMVLKRIIDPTMADKLRLPKTEHDLMIQAKENALLVFDNVSGVKWDMSDALCALSTGSGYATRRYYTDNEIRMFSFSRPFIINGIGNFASRPDLLERAIPLKLEPMTERMRRPEKEILAQFEEILPGVLGELYAIIAHALKYKDKVVPPREIRMADAASWLAAAEGRCGVPEGTFVDALSSSQNDLMVDTVINNPLTIALQAVAERGQFHGTIGGLHATITGDHERHLPPTPQHLSNALERNRPALARAGIKIEFGTRTRKGRWVTVTLDYRDDGEPL